MCHIDSRRKLPDIGGKKARRSSPLLKLGSPTRGKSPAKKKPEALADIDLRKEAVMDKGISLVQHCIVAF